MSTKSMRIAVDFVDIQVEKGVCGVFFSFLYCTRSQYTTYRW